MPRTHVVRQGEDIATLAEDSGLLPETIWDDPANAPLKERARAFGILHPGDEIVIPDVRPRKESCATDQRHRFRRKGVEDPWLRIVLVDADDEPLANIAYTLVVDDRRLQGKTDGDGLLEVKLPRNAKTVTLTYDEIGEEYELRLAELDPVTEVTGVQARLENLGYWFGPVDGESSAQLEHAIKAFQDSCGLSATGEADAATCDALVAEHGC